MQALKISMSALNVEWQRLNIIADNLANINTSRNELGETFKPKRLLSGPDVNFDQLLKTDDALGYMNNPAGVKVMGLEDIPGAERQVYEPEHPHADGEGFVTYPKINHASEMTLMIKTSRAYEANLTAISIAQQMYNRALQMGK